MININKLSATTILAGSLLLNGCGGGSGSDNATAGPIADDEQVSLAGVVSLKGKVADGYLQHATVCLDINGNKACDSNEPATTTDANGDYTIPDVTQADIDKHPVIVKVIAGVTIDADYGTTPLAKSYTLSAPPGKGDFISPLTTMVQTRLEAEPSSNIDQVESQLLASMGQTDDDISLFTDYIAEDANTDYKTLHKLAQVTATTISTQIEVAEAAVSLSPEQFDALMQIVVTSVIDEIPSIINTVDTDTTTDFSNPDDLVSLSSSVGVEIDATTLEDDLAAIQIAETATATTFAAFMEDGFNWFEAGHDGEQLWVEHGKVGLNTSDNTTTETAYEYNFATAEFVPVPSSVSDYFLTPNGWVGDDETFSSDIMIFNADGSATVTDSVTGEIFSLYVEAIDISGLNIKSFLGNVANNGELELFVNGTATFAPGATAYELIWFKDTGYYNIFRDTDCPEVNTLAGNCNWTYRSNGTPFATQLSDLLVETASVINQDDGDPSNDDLNSHAYLLGDFKDCDVDPITFTEICYLDQSLEYQLVGTGTSGTVNFYLNDHLETNTDSGNNRIIPVASGTWTIEKIHNQDLLVLDIPTELRYSFGHIIDDILEPEEELFFAVHNGYVRTGNHVPAGTAGVDIEMLFDDAATVNIKTATVF